VSKYDELLPFPRGQTMVGGAFTPAVGYGSNVWGQVYDVMDTVHGTNKPMKLRAMSCEAAITVARKFYMPGTTALDFGRTIAGVNSAAGGPAWALDDAYTVGDTIPQYDVAWFVEEGPVYVKSESSSVSLSQFGGVVSDTSGLIDGAAPAAGNVVLGRLDIAATATSTNYVVHIGKMVGGEGA
jgi:hypothetical protein